jgi:glycosyltransferase involved in cell wall biosynthesis
MNPLVSILIPVFNQNEEHFRQCVQSALDQTYDNYEIVISDNHSTNGLAKVIEEFNDKKIRLVKPPVFLSMNANFSFAGANAHSESKYYSFLSSDDLLYPTAITELVALLESDPQVVFAAGNIHRCMEPPTDIETTNFLIRPLTQSTRKLDDEQALRVICPWRMASTWMAGDLIRASAYKKTGGLAQCNYLANGDQWLTKELLQHGKLGLIDKPLAFYRMRPPGVDAADGDRSLGIIMDNLSYYTDLRHTAQKLNNKGVLSTIAQAKWKFRFTAISLLLINRGNKVAYPAEKSDAFNKYIHTHTGALFKFAIATAMHLPYILAVPAKHLILKLRNMKFKLNKGAFS